MWQVEQEWKLISDAKRCTRFYFSYAAELIRISRDYLQLTLLASVHVRAKTAARPDHTRSDSKDDWSPLCLHEVEDVSGIFHSQSQFQPMVRLSLTTTTDQNMQFKEKNKRQKEEEAEREKNMQCTQWTGSN